MSTKMGSSTSNAPTTIWTGRGQPVERIPLTIRTSPELNDKTMSANAPNSHVATMTTPANTAQLAGLRHVDRDARAVAPLLISRHATC